ncbi:MAG: T9SS type A sorting domain-containing protein [Bacteroidetes bacterium]|nr:T9SS type A sorting domain-containing protein [Bacteroidota bacterium]
MSGLRTLHGWICCVLLLAVPFYVRSQFVERAAEAGVYLKYDAAIYIGGGVGLIDVNNDLKLDMFLTGGVARDRLYINNGNGFSREVLYVAPEDFDLLEDITIGVAVGDVNNDGYDDLFLCTQKDYPSRLLINNGNETFNILTPEESGINESDWNVSAVFGDVNSDGLLDIYSTNYVDTTHSYWDAETETTIFLHKGFKNYLYINQGGNHFVEMADAYGVQQEGNSLSGIFTDYDNDRDADIYVINDFGEFVIPNELYENQYPVDMFDDRSAASGADIGLFGMGIAVGDYDLDMDLDYYVTNIGRNVLLRNNGDGTFEDATNEAGVQDSIGANLGRLTGWATGFFDYDNDGYSDLFVSNGFIPAADDILNARYNENSLYYNNGDGSFTKMADSMGLANPAACRGAAFGDLDSDGDLDLIFVPISTSDNRFPSEVNDKVAIYYNETPNTGNWIQIKLEGVSSNRSGYGAHVIVYFNGNSLLREANPGSHASSNSPFIHFGFGAVSQLDSLVVLWPSGIRQVLYQPEINMLHIIREGQDPVIQATQTNTFVDATVYPNPFSSQLELTAGKNFFQKIKLQYRLTSVDGKAVKQGYLGTSTSTIQTGDLAVGAYVLHLIFENEIVWSQKLIKE